LSRSVLDELLAVVRVDQLLYWLDELGPGAPTPAGGPQPALVRRELKAISDADLLKRLVPSELHGRLWGAGHMGMHALSFALRARLSYLALLSHLACLEEGEHELAKLNLDSDDPEADLLMVAGFPWTHGLGLPVIGFAAMGAFVIPVARGGCRAFDIYDLPGCGQPAEDGLFCAEHRGEAWWRKEAPSGLRQATMCSFYFNHENFEQFDEATLKKLVEDFLRRVRDYTADPEEIDAALQRFGLAHRDELKRVGLPELRRRFLQAAHASHPDKGGEANAFVTFRHSYDVLKRWLASAP
jgi:hypothetical protein